MTSAATTYDLMLILDPQAEETARGKIVADARAAIESGGELTRHDEWGERPLTYPIERRASGEYHLLQFHAGCAQLLDGLDRSLRIADEVLRFRIIKLRPGTPEAPDMRPAAQRRPAEEAQDAPPAAEAAPAPPAAEAAPAPAAEPVEAPAAQEPVDSEPAEEAVQAPAAPADEGPGDAAGEPA